jgi:hypothetical protein
MTSDLSNFPYIFQRKTGTVALLTYLPADHVRICSGNQEAGANVYIPYMYFGEARFKPGAEHRLYRRFSGFLQSLRETQNSRPIHHSNIQRYTV